MSLIHNERRKLTATLLNGVAIAMMATGFVAPVVAVSYGVSNAPLSLFLVGTAAVWFFVALGLHLVARAILGGLKE